MSRVTQRFPPLRLEESRRVLLLFWRSIAAHVVAAPEKKAEEPDPYSFLREPVTTTPPIKMDGPPDVVFTEKTLSEIPPRLSGLSTEISLENQDNIKMMVDNFKQRLINNNLPYTQQNINTLQALMEDGLSFKGAFKRIVERRREYEATLRPSVDIELEPRGKRQVRGEPEETVAMETSAPSATAATAAAEIASAGLVPPPGFRRDERPELPAAVRELEPLLNLNTFGPIAPNLLARAQAGEKIFYSHETGRPLSAWAAFVAQHSYEIKEKYAKQLKEKTLTFMQAAKKFGVEKGFKFLSAAEKKARKKASLEALKARGKTPEAKKRAKERRAAKKQKELEKARKKETKKKEKSPAKKKKSSSSKKKAAPKKKKKAAPKKKSSKATKKTSSRKKTKSKKVRKHVSMVATRREKIPNKYVIDKLQKSLASLTKALKKR
jgi:hypothetical protein